MSRVQSPADDGLTPDVTVNLDWGAAPDYDPSKPFTTTTDLLNFIAAHKAASKMPSPYTLMKVRPALPESNPPNVQSGSGAAGLYNLAADAGDALSVPIRALLGHPEDILSSGSRMLGGGKDAYGTSLPGIELPNAVSGAIDLASSLPIFGGLELARGGLREVKPFFSQLARTIEERAPAIATPEQFMAIARKGSKAEELAYSGLEDFLNAAGPKVKKDDVLAHLATNAPELHESMIAGNPDPTQPWNDPKIMPQFASYTLPGGENQRELIVTLPPKVNESEQAFNNWLADHKVRDVAENSMSEADLHRATNFNGMPMDAPLTRERFDTLPPTMRQDWRNEYQHTLDNFSGEELGSAAQPPSEYRVPGGHAYGDPALDVNRLFHMRMNDRTTTAGEKALHLEEIQSDWHQAGREQGYGSDAPQLNEGYNIRQLSKDEIDKRNLPGWEYLKPGDYVVEGPGGTQEPIHGGGTAADALRRLRTEYSQDANGHQIFKKSGGVPDAPFKKTWQELGMRRALQEAAAGDYDRLTWTTGAQQADRYSLAHHVDSLNYNPGANRLVGYKDGRQVINHTITQDQLATTIGQEAASKLMQTPLLMGEHILKGQDLQVGGEGMKGFYDKILPDYANKVGKKYGVKVEDAEIPVTSGKSYVDAGDGHELTDEELQDRIDQHRQDMAEWDAQGIRDASHIELLERNGLTEDDVKPGGAYGDDTRNDLKNRLISHANDMDNEDIRALYQRLHPVGNAHVPNRDSIIAFLHEAPLSREQLAEELEGHHGYYEGDFEPGGDLAGRADHQLRNDLFDQMENISDAEVLYDLVDGDYIKRAPQTHNETIHSLKITPEMKKDILQNGQQLFGVAAAAALAPKAKSKGPALEDLMSAEATRRHLRRP